jgi:hypothetical protein
MICGTRPSGSSSIPSGITSAPIPSIVVACISERRDIALASTNARRPHSSLEHLTPNECVAQRKAMKAAAKATPL